MKGDSIGGEFIEGGKDVGALGEGGGEVTTGDSKAMAENTFSADRSSSLSEGKRGEGVDSVAMGKSKRNIGFFGKEAVGGRGLSISRAFFSLFWVQGKDTGGDTEGNGEEELSWVGDTIRLNLSVFMHVCLYA